MRRLVPLLRLIAALAVAAPAAARDESGAFDVYLGGVRAGTLAFSFAVADGRYGVRARAEPSGLVRLVYDVGYAAEATGRIAGNGYVPGYFREERIRRDGTERAEIRFRGGVPGRKTYDPPRGPEDQVLDPAEQGGAADPMTAAFAGLRDTPEGRLCAVDLAVWDGERRGRVTLDGPRAVGAARLCDGAFTRVAGYSEDDLRDQRRFPFTLRYEPLGDGWWRLVEARAPSSAGRVVLKRR